MKELQLEKTLELEAMGIETSLLNSKLIFTRDEVIKILACANSTLNNFEKRGWIKSSRFKNKKFYSRACILKCINIQSPLKAKTNSD